MKAKYYNVIVALEKWIESKNLNDVQVHQFYSLVENKEEAIDLAFKSNKIISLFKQGYAVKYKDADEIPPVICPQNGEGD